MALKNLMVRLQSRAAVTPVTPEKSTGLQPEPAWIGACTFVTPVTPLFVDTRAIVQIGEAGNGLARPEPDAPENLIKPAMPVAANDPTPEPPTDPNAWRELAAAYHAHHFNCSVCIAAGRGAGYGLRCGAGAALWIPYDRASERTP